MIATESSLARLAPTISRKLAFTFFLALCASIFTLSAFSGGHYHYLRSTGLGADDAYEHQCRRGHHGVLLGWDHDSRISENA
jgi:hypothetical protein